MRYHNCRNILCVTPHYPEPAKTSYTNETIPITCGECATQEIGVDQMSFHIMEAHRHYSAMEAIKFAEVWAENAFEELEK